MIDHALLPALERFRVRAGLTALVRATTPAACLTWGGAEAARVLIFDAPPSREVFTLPATLAVSLVAALVVWLRRPGLSEVARAVDARLGLQAAVVTALQFHADGDPFAVHTVDLAVDRLRGADPGRVYAWTLPRLAQAIVVAGLLAGASALFWHPRTAEDREGSVDPDRAVTAGAATPRAGVTSPATRAQSPRATPIDEPRPSGRPLTSPDTRATQAELSTRPTVTAAPPSVSPAAASTVDPSAHPSGDQPQAFSTGRTSKAPSAGTGLTGRDGGEGAGQGRTDAPGGGKAGGRGGRQAPSAEGQPTAGSSATAAPDEHAVSLERVPMSRRTYVQRYLHSLSRAEPR